MSASDVPRRTASLAEVTSADRTVVLKLDEPAEPPMILPDIAQQIWALVDGKSTVELIANRSSLSLQLVQDFLVALMAAGLVRHEAWTETDWAEAEDP